MRPVAGLAAVPDGQACSANWICLLSRRRTLQAETAVGPCAGGRDEAVGREIIRGHRYQGYARTSPRKEKERRTDSTVRYSLDEDADTEQGFSVRAQGREAGRGTVRPES